MKDFTIESLKYSPRLKELLIMYVLRTYEEAANTSDESLFAEYVHLRDNNMLNELFIEEAFCNFMIEEWNS